ncbi:MAG: pentapeptide repeat-containing protein [Gemmobacter sp.]
MPKDDPRDLLDWMGLSRTPAWVKSRLLGGLAGVALAVLLVFLVVSAIILIVSSLLAAAGTTPGATLGAGGLIVALLGAPFLIWNTVIRHKALGFQKEGHITDRISKAVEQLGAEKTVKRPLMDTEGNPRLDDGGKPIVAEQTVPNIEVRIGGILSLERIAQDSCAYDKGRDHVRVMEILCAYVRENAPATSLDPTPEIKTRKKPRIDIQKALDVIKRRSSEQEEIEADVRYRLDLRDCDLDGCDLSGGNFSGAIMWRCRCEGTNFTKSSLVGTNLAHSLLNFASFRNATMRGTNLNYCVLTETGFFSAILGNLAGVWIEGARMTALSFSTRAADDLFGSKDTQLRPDFDDFKREGLKFADRLHLDEMIKDGDRLVQPGEQVSRNAQQFLHWNPFDSDDYAAEEFRSKYRKRKGLVGWPFDD